MNDLNCTVLYSLELFTGYASQRIPGVVKSERCHGHDGHLVKGLDVSRTSFERLSALNGIFFASAVFPCLKKFD